MINTSELKTQINLVKTIYFSLIAGMFTFFLVVIILIQDKEFETGKDIDKIFTFLIPMLGLVMMFFSRMLYNQMIQKSDPSVNLLQKISHYRTIKIISWAMIESACILALVATMLTSNYLYVIVFIFLFGYFIIMKPSKESLIRDMRLNSEESDLVQRS